MNLNVSTILTSHVCCLIPSLFFNFFFKLNRTEKNSKTFGKKTQFKWKNSKMNTLRVCSQYFPHNLKKNRTLIL